jgi:signal transduction histidine kinase
VLHEFLSANRGELIRRCREKVEKRRAPRPTEAELEHGIPQFLHQLITTLRLEEQKPWLTDEAGSPSSEHGRLSGPAEPAAAPGPSAIGRMAAKHGHDLQGRGFTVDQVVHDYGDLCQAVTELALERKAPFTTNEFRTLNRCLDSAIADAVSQYSRDREKSLSEEGERASTERLGVFAHELRNSLNTATLAISALRSGKVAFGGATGALLDRTMWSLRDLIDRSLADVRLEAGIPVPCDRIPLARFIEELQVGAAMEANARGLELTVAAVDAGLTIDGDQQILASAVSNLLSNAIKFTREHGHVWLRAHAPADRILIEVQDECGGLTTERIEDLFRPFEQQHSDRSGVGLGLSISRRGVEASGGTLSARSLAGHGCVFTVDLPKPPTRD